MPILELDASQYVKQGRIFKKFDSNLLDSYMDGRQNNYNINLAELDDQISDGIVYAGRNGKMIYKFGAKKIIQTAITNGLEISGLNKDLEMKHYSFWVPDLYFVSFYSFNPNEDLYIAYRSKDEEFICLTNIWPDGSSYAEDYFPNGDRLTLKRLCKGSMMSDVSSSDYDAWRNNAVTRASQFVNKFVSARGNSDLDFVGSALRSKVPSHNIKKCAVFLGTITKEQENVNTYEEFMEWTKNTKWFK